MPKKQEVRMRITVVATLEYTDKFKDYETDDVEKILAMDRETADDDLFLFLDNEDTKWDVKIEALS